MYNAEIMDGLMEEVLKQCDRAIRESQIARDSAVVIEDLKHVKNTLLRYQSSMRSGVLKGGDGAGFGLVRALDEISAPDYLFDAGARATEYFQTGTIKGLS